MKKLSYLILTLAAFSFLFSSCGRVEGEGPIIQETISTPDFTGVELAGGFDVEVVVGGSFSVLAEGQENIIERLQTNVKPDGTLELKLDHGWYRNYDLKIYITMPIAENFCISGSGDMTVDIDEAVQLDKLDLIISGSGNMIGLTDFEVANEVDAKISGSGNMEFDLDAAVFEGKISGSGYMKFDLVTNHSIAKISGSGRMDLIGSAPHQEINISGSGDYNGFEYYADMMDVTITGSGNVQCRVSQELSVKITGSGDVWYKGQPLIDVETTGSGKLRSAN